MHPEDPHSLRHGDRTLHESLTADGLIRAGLLNKMREGIDTDAVEKGEDILIDAQTKDLPNQQLEDRKKARSNPAEPMFPPPTVALIIHDNSGRNHYKKYPKFYQ